MIWKLKKLIPGTNPHHPDIIEEDAGKIEVGSIDEVPAALRAHGAQDGENYIAHGKSQCDGCGVDWDVVVDQDGIVAGLDNDTKRCSDCYKELGGLTHKNHQC